MSLPTVLLVDSKNLQMVHGSVLESLGTNPEDSCDFDLQVA